jgi:hypothetical protein
MGLSPNRDIRQLFSTVNGGERNLMRGHAMTRQSNPIRAAILVCSVVALVSCGTSDSDGENTQGNQNGLLSTVPSDVQTAVALDQTRLESSLKDAPSARFQDRFVSRGGERLVYCGEVNARNSFGGYNGFRRFIVSPNDPIIIDGAAPAFDLAWSGECSNPIFKLDQ